MRKGTAWLLGVAVAAIVAVALVIHLFAPDLGRLIHGDQ
jgi:uncharacterized protein involved in outer membrane biogenesis